MKYNQIIDGDWDHALIDSGEQVWFRRKVKAYSDNEFEYRYIVEDKIWHVWDEKKFWDAVSPSNVPYGIIRTLRGLRL